ncbi:MAG: GTPase Era [Ruminococcaceae bacterium]|nr:GTPase Era [Oscillospiraceae bacterium]
MEQFKSGFATVVGMPNVGKSTLINELVGQKISIVSNKPQTTRNQITAIYQDEESQIVFVDTPGVHKPKNKLGNFMVNAAFSALDDMDLVLFMVDATKQGDEQELIQKLHASSAAVILVINKVDLVPKEKLLPLIQKYSDLCNFEAVIPISALKKDGIEELISVMKKFLPYGPRYFPDDMVTDQSERQIAAELIREKVLRFLSQEVPHGVAVEIEGMKTEGEMCRINAVIYTEKASHKMILIGKNGAMMKKIGTSARKELERFLDCKVHLELWVKVKEDWRNNDYLIKNFGYEEQK